jgi:hypothetical protein
MKDKTSYFLVRSLFIGIGLSKLFELTSFNIITFLVGFIFGFIILNTIINKIIYNKLNLILITIYLNTILINLCHSLYLDNTSLILLIIFTNLVIYLISSISDKAFNILSYKLYKLSIILIILSIILLLPHIKLNNFINTNNNYLFSSFYLGILSTYPLININLNNKKETIINYIISFITIFILSFIMEGVLGYKEILMYRFPEYIVFKRINILNFIYNVDNIFLFIYIIDLILASSKCIKNITDIKLNKIVIIILISILSYIICKNSTLLNLINNYFIYITISLFIATILVNIFKYKTKKNNI